MWKAVKLEQTADLMKRPANTVKKVYMQLKTVEKKGGTKSFAPFVRGGDLTLLHVGFEKSGTNAHLQGARKGTITLFRLLTIQQLFWNIQGM